ncbi:MAG: hypothetical protein WBG36_05520 [Ornithinimicrobium sp.]
MAVVWAGSREDAAPTISHAPACPNTASRISQNHDITLRSKSSPVVGSAIAALAAVAVTLATVSPVIVWPGAFLLPWRLT